VQDPGALARCKARSQQAVVDFPRYGEPVERRRRKVQAPIVRKAIRWGVGVAFDRGDDAVAVGVDAGDFGGIGIKQPLLEVLNPRLERRQSLVDVEIDFVGKVAGAITSLPVPLPAKLTSSSPETSDTSSRLKNTRGYPSSDL
jgi:hypothetical protein